MGTRHWLGIGLALGLGATASAALTSTGQADGLPLFHATATVSEGVSTVAHESPSRLSPFAIRAYQTRVGLHRGMLDEVQLGQYCPEANTARTTLALHAQEKLSHGGADSLPRGEVVQRNVKLLLPCAGGAA